MNIAEWFDPHNIDHIKAYRFLSETGTWPIGFVPLGMEFGPVWYAELATKMAECWVQHALGETL